MLSRYIAVGVIILLGIDYALGQNQPELPPSPIVARSSIQPTVPPLPSYFVTASGIVSPIASFVSQAVVSVVSGSIDSSTITSLSSTEATATTSSTTLATSQSSVLPGAPISAAPSALSSPIMVSSSTPTASSSLSTTTSASASSQPASSSPATETPSSITTAVPAPANLHHRNLIIILSVVLGVVAILILAIVIFLVRRCQRRRLFPGRNITPIGDEEIESWRLGTAGSHFRYKNDAKSSSQQTFSEKLPPIPSNPFTARAPNARSGLTDSAVPGADPFITPPRRYSARLQKSPHHSRNTTAQSSISDRPPTPFRDHYDGVEDIQGMSKRPRIPEFRSVAEGFNFRS